MYDALKRVTSGVVAFAIVLGTLAVGPIITGKKNIVNAAALKYDSASAINYATILGGAVDYGVVAPTIVQNSHTETTFATFNYVHNKSCIDVDYITSTALFLIGNSISTDGNESTLRNIQFGYTTASAIYLEGPESIYGPNKWANHSYQFNPSLKAKQNIQNGNIWYTSSYSVTEDNPPFIQATNENADSNVRRLLNRMLSDNAVEDAEKGWSYFLQDRAEDPAYVTDWRSVKDTDTSHDTDYIY